MNNKKQEYLDKKYKVLYEYNENLIMYKTNKDGVDIFYNIDEIEADIYFERDEIEMLYNDIKK